jgi:hypothetical protein
VKTSEKLSTAFRAVTPSPPFVSTLAERQTHRQPMPLSSSGVKSLWRYVKSAPLTYSWLVVLLITTIVQHSIPARRLHALLQKQSTNLHHLASDPIRVLVQSLLWIDGKYWWPYLVVFTLFLAPAERWLGRLRWLLVGLVCHVGATYLSDGYLYWTIQQALASPRLIDARDIGVSYFVTGIVAVLTYHIARPWRWVYLVGTVVVFGVAFAVRTNFTGLGHLCAVGLGLACYPLVGVKRSFQWDPAETVRRVRRSTTPAA